MKKLLIFIPVFLLFCTCSYGQKWGNDPTYSEHNYKHPNKAKAAKLFKEENDSKSEPQIVFIPGTGNYKAQNFLTKRIPISISPAFSSESSRINRNYKQQFSPSSTEIIKEAKEDRLISLDSMGRSPNKIKVRENNRE